MSGQSSKSKSYGYQESNPLTPDELGAYYAKLNQLTGNKLGAQSGIITEPTEYKELNADLTYRPSQWQDLNYKPVSDAQIKNLGGAGATRQLAAQQGRQQAIEQLLADPSLSIYQRQRSNQLINRDYSSQSDAIAKEVEAALAGAALQQAQADQQGRVSQAELEQQARAAQAMFSAGQHTQDYQARLANSMIPRGDLALLADIFFAGKGQRSKGENWSSSKSSGGGI